MCTVILYSTVLQNTKRRNSSQFGFGQFSEAFCLYFSEVFSDLQCFPSLQRQKNALPRGTGGVGWGEEKLLGWFSCLAKEHMSGEGSL